MTDIRTGFGYDIHRLVEGEYLLLGRVRIPADKMIDAHSDGDIVLHSLAQAIFSSLGLEDIGTYFPDNSGETAGIDSSVLVNTAMKEMEERQFRQSNVTVAIVLQKPKLKEYKPLIKTNLSHLLGLPEERIAVHANTSERLGPVGEGKAVVCYCVVTIVKD